MIGVGAVDRAAFRTAIHIAHHDDVPVVADDLGDALELTKARALPERQMRNDQNQRIVTMPVTHRERATPRDHAGQFHFDHFGRTQPAQYPGAVDRKSTRLNSSHMSISYAV